jgi:hypothetical protein
MVTACPTSRVVREKVKPVSTSGGDTTNTMGEEETLNPFESCTETVTV